MKLLTPLTLALSTIAGCADDSELESSLRRYEGIYEVVLHGANTSACSPDGAVPFVGTDTFAVTTVEYMLGRPYLNIAGCASPAACRELAAMLARDELVSYSFGYSFVKTDGADLLGGGASTGFLRGEVCTQGTLHESRLFGTADAEVTAFRIEERITVADDYPADEETCTTEATKAAARGNTCSQMEVLSVRLVERL